MSKICEEHNVRETRRGAGPCDISYEVHLRSGRPNWWCRTHGLAAGAPDGAALDACPGSWFEPVPPDRRLDIDVAQWEIAVWGVVPPAITAGPVADEEGKVHVHQRRSGTAEKEIDGSFDIVVLRNGDAELTVEGMAAAAYSISELSGRQVAALTCPRCGERHIDELKFATRPHRKHLCNSCGRNFSDRTGPSISNPLADAHAALGLPPAPPPARPDRPPLTLNSGDYAAIAMWPSNAAIVSTMSRPEDEGIHVHAWTDDGTLVIDETYSPVILDGTPIDEAHLRHLAVQRALADGHAIISLPCGSCGTPLLSPTDGWIEPLTTHVCAACGHTTKTRRKVFINPLADKGQPAR